MTVHNVDGQFPDGDARARTALDETLASIPGGARVVIDGLAMSGLPESLVPHQDRLRIVGLVHHPLADETGLSPEEKEHFTRTERAALATCTGVLVTSGYTAHRLEDFGVPATRVRAVPPGTAPAAPSEGPVGGPPILLCVATVTRRKGHDVLIEALDEVKALEWTCVCAGSLERDGAWVAHVQAMVAERGLKGRVDFVGEHDADSLERYYRSASVFVLASHYEGYGMALAEALARGLPIVSTTGGAIPFTVPSETGLLVPPGDAHRFADGLRSVLDDASRRTMSAAALRYGRTLPDWDASVEAFGRAITELSGAPAP